MTTTPTPTTPPNQPEPDGTSETPSRGVRVPDGALWASAVVLAGLILALGARVADRPAYAEMAVKAGSYSMVTTEAGDSEALVVLDDREERLLVYTVSPGDKFELRASQDLAELFGGARAAQAAP